MLVAVLAGLATRYTEVKEDASFAGFYLLSLSLGVLLVSKTGSNVDLMHLLFGSVLAVDDHALLLVAGVASFTVLSMALVYRLCCWKAWIRCSCAPSAPAVASGICCSCCW